MESLVWSLGGSLTSANHRVIPKLTQQRFQEWVAEATEETKRKFEGGGVTLNPEATVFLPIHNWSERSAGLLPVPNTKP